LHQEFPKKIERCRLPAAIYECPLVMPLWSQVGIIIGFGTILDKDAARFHHITISGGSRQRQFELLSSHLKNMTWFFCNRACFDSKPYHKEG
jgi:hypothetical protein